MALLIDTCLLGEWLENLELGRFWQYLVAAPGLRGSEATTGGEHTHDRGTAA